MSTNIPQQPSSTPPASGGNSDNNSRQRLIAIAAVIIVALLVVNIFLLVNKFKQDRLNDELTGQLDETQQLKAELEEQYYQAIAELEDQKGENEQLNSLIDEQKGELLAQKRRIEGLLRNKNELDKARTEIKKLTEQANQYLAEVNRLREENEELSARTAELSEQNLSLRTNLDSQRMANEELSTTKAALVSEKEKLEADRMRLARKVNVASVIKVTDVVAEGLKLRSSGRKVSRRDASNVDELQVCFNTTTNVVAEPGPERFFVRILNPLGETLAVENLGSGVFVSNADNEQVRYTQVLEYDYDRDVTELCMNWAPNQPLLEGSYTVEVYNKGYLAGSAEFSLR